MAKIFSGLFGGGGKTTVIQPPSPPPMPTPPGDFERLKQLQATVLKKRQKGSGRTSSILTQPEQGSDTLGGA